MVGFGFSSGFVNTKFDSVLTEAKSYTTQRVQDGARKAKGLVRYQRIYVLTKLVPGSFHDGTQFMAYVCLTTEFNN